MNNEKEVYTIEEVEPSLFQSVFPASQAEFSQLHTSLEDAITYIREVAGDVRIEKESAVSPSWTKEQCATVVRTTLRQLPILPV